MSTMKMVLLTMQCTSNRSISSTLGTPMAPPRDQMDRTIRTYSGKASASRCSNYPCRILKSLSVRDRAWQWMTAMQHCTTKMAATRSLQTWALWYASVTRRSWPKCSSLKTCSRKSIIRAPGLAKLTCWSIALLSREQLRKKSSEGRSRIKREASPLEFFRIKRFKSKATGNHMAHRSNNLNHIITLLIY